MPCSTAMQIKGTVVLKTNAASDDAPEEVQFLAVAFSSTNDIVQSQDPKKPWCYHSSRDVMLQQAQEMKKAGILDIFGLGGPAVELVIPGTPWPQGADFQGDQTQDVGCHLTLFCKKPEPDAVSPDLEKAKAMVGREVICTMLPPEEDGVKILVGAESNDMKTGICYYLSVAFDDTVPNQLREEVGLPRDPNQVFHQSIAGLAPAWQTMHPKSQLYRSMHQSFKDQIDLLRDFQIFRKGLRDFQGFNADHVTQWTTHALQSAAMGRRNVPQAVTMQNAAAYKSALPDASAQAELLTSMAEKMASEEDMLQRCMSAKDTQSATI